MKIGSVKSWAARRLFRPTHPIQEPPPEDGAVFAIIVSMKRYNPSEIEPKWQATWASDKRYEVHEDSTKPKYYVTGMFPYPSGAGMHTGHFFEHSIVDAVARFRRALGYNVMYPMGWDSFGLPAENYAIKTGKSPQETTETNIDNFKNQLRRVGASIDWSREINTTDPEYYKWTQWIFTQLLDRGLAYQKEAMQWWCPKDKTVLANEQVVDGKCWRCESVVVKKAMKQWFFKITDYADALLEEIPALNWPDKIKTAQTNWIGRSQGAEIEFTIDASQNIVGLHGYMGRPNNDFWPHLKATFEQTGSTVNVLDLPNPEQPDAMEQARYALEHATFDSRTTLIGHSFGSVVALRILEKLETPIERLVLVAGFDAPGFLDEVRPFETTTDWEFDYAKIRQNVREVVILRDTTDHVVPKERAEQLRDHLGGRLIDVAAEVSHFCGATEPGLFDALRQCITVFTTRPDTIFGATFLVLAPEHPLARTLMTDETRETVEAYIAEAVKKSEIERSSDSKEKTGVFTGSYATNPATGEKIPIWIADYVLWGYGTGAIMAVPAHDERDFEFAKQFNLPITQVVARFLSASKESNQVHPDQPFIDRFVAQCIVRHPKEDKILVLRVHGHNWTTLPMGGVETGEDLIEAAKREVYEETGYKSLEFVQFAGQELWSEFYAEHKQVNRRAHFQGLEFRLHNLEQDPLDSEEAAKHDVEWISPSDAIAQFTEDEPRYFLRSSTESTNGLYCGEGKLINSGAFSGMETSDAREQIVAWLEQQGVGRPKITYKMRDWLISRQRYWGAPIPVVYCEKDGVVAVPQKDLPVLLPVIEDFAPRGDGQSALGAQEDWVNTTCPTCGGAARRETDTMDGYACSSWYLLRYTDPHDDIRAWDPARANYWAPVDMYVGGDHAVAHLLYVRFWTHVFKDMGLTNFKEPVDQLVYHGLIQAEDGRKMSKSLGNTIDPLEVIDQGYGADALRTFELFLGPINEDSNWSSRGIAGVYRFLNRTWTLTQEYMANEKAEKSDSSKALSSLTHATIKKVTDDINRLSFNTAIAALMEYVNELYKLKLDGFTLEWREAIESLVKLVQPFAPHMAAELWEQLGHSDQLDTVDWPSWDESKIISDTMTIVVQVNGKVRAKLEVPATMAEDDIKKAALGDDNVAKFLDGNEVKKVIYIAGRLVSIVV